MRPVDTHHMVYRADHIRQTLDHHFLVEINIAVATPEPTWWWDNVTIFGVVGPLGFGPPVPNPTHVPGGDNPMIIAYCPEIIDEQTQDLTNDELDDYLVVIHFIIDLHLVEWDEDDQDRRHETIMTMLASEHPEQHAILQAQLALVEFRRGLRDM